MLDFGFPELLVIIAVAVLVIGPAEIPAVMRTIGRLVKRLNYMRFAISRQFDEFMGEDVETQVNFSRHMSRAENRASKNSDFDEKAEDEELASAHEIAEEEGDDERSS